MRMLALALLDHKIKRGHLTCSPLGNSMVDYAVTETQNFFAYCHSEAANSSEHLTVVIKRAAPP